MGLMPARQAAAPQVEESSSRRRRPNLRLFAQHEWNSSPLSCLVENWNMAKTRLDLKIQLSEIPTRDRRRS